MGRRTDACAKKFMTIRAYVMRSRDTLRGPFPFATLLDSPHPRRFFSSFARFPSARGIERRARTCRRRPPARSAARASRPVAHAHASPRVVGLVRARARPARRPEPSSRASCRRGETNASSARDAMAPDENAGAPVGFARTPTRHALMESNANELSAPTSAAKLASFKGRYVSHARHRRTPEPLRRARRTPRVSRVRDWALKKAFFSVGVFSHLSFSSRNVFFSLVLASCRSRALRRWRRR